jgi:hypothetical protein
MTVVVFGISFCCLIKSDEKYSNSERRLLEQTPTFTLGAFVNGDFTEDFEVYALDQFLLRDNFRTIKALTAYNIFGNLDNNGIYVANGYVSKLNYPLSYNMLDNVADKFEYLYHKYMENTDTKLYFSIIPDKNYYLAETSGRLAFDYEELFSYMQEKTSYMEFIDITDLLTIENYYMTDTHWKQETLLPVANRICSAMGVSLSEDYISKKLNGNFYGVYAGQSAIPLEADTLMYLTNDVLENCTVTSYDSGSAKEISIYTLDKANGSDPYEIFLNGADPLIVIDNPSASTSKELIVFRDSFGSALVPLLVECYSKITVIDIRYISSDYIGNYVNFSNQDVLFLYSSMLLNSSLGLK